MSLAAGAGGWAGDIRKWNSLTSGQQDMRRNGGSGATYVWGGGQEDRSWTRLDRDREKNSAFNTGSCLSFPALSGTDLKPATVCTQAGCCGDSKGPGCWWGEGEVRGGGPQMQRAASVASDPASCHSGTATSNIVPLLDGPVDRKRHGDRRDATPAPPPAPPLSGVMQGDVCVVKNGRE